MVLVGIRQNGIKLTSMDCCDVDLKAVFFKKGSVTKGALMRSAS